MAANKQKETKVESDFELKLYPLDENEFIGSIWVDREEISNSIPTFVLLDSSNSMGDATSRFVNEIIPLVVSKLSYGKQHPIHLITFGKETTHHKIPAEEFKSLKLYTGNAARMAPAIQRLHSLVQSVIPNKPIRVLSISDGQIGDHDEAALVAKDLMRFLDTLHFSINSQAVRLFTSESQPDTKALCCILQINNTTTSKLLDINVTESNEIIATKIAKLFQLDNFSKCTTLEMEKEILLKYPWDSTPSLRILLVPGLNIFWLKLVPTGGKLGNKSIKVSIQDPLTLAKFQDLMETKLVHILDHMKILKVIGNDEANKSVDQMLKYFEAKESKLAQRCSISSTKKISTLLAVIANDNNINNRDSARMAEYLRDTGGTRKFQKSATSNSNTNSYIDADAKSCTDTNTATVDEVFYTTQELGAIRKIEEKEGEESTAQKHDSVCPKHGETYKVQSGNTDSSITATNEEKELKLNIYPLDENGFIGTIWIEDDEQIPKAIQTVILLDRSNYMGDETRRFTNEIIPLVMSKLSYSESQRVHFITFANYPQLEFVTAAEMKSLSSEHYGRDHTRMASAIKYVHSYFQVGSHSSPQFNANKPVRVLVISAGGVEDYEDIESNSTALLEYLHASDFSINSQAVRLITSTSQPDIKALCSILQMNNMTAPRLLNIDAKESNENIATAIAQVFQTDNFSRSKILMMEESIILKFPWNTKPSSQIMVVPGLNLFWLKKIPMGDIRMRNKHVDIVMKNQLTLTKFQDMIEPKLPHIVNHINILRVLDNVKANKTVESILKYFATKEDDLAKSSNCSSLCKKISNLLADTANGNNIKILIPESAMDNGQKQSENVKNIVAPVLVQNLRDCDVKQSENIDFPANVNKLRGCIENQSESFDSPTIIKIIQGTCGKQSENLNIFHSTPITETLLSLQDVSSQAKNLENPEPAPLVKDLQHDKQFEIMKHLDTASDKNQRDVNGKQSESMESVHTPPNAGNSRNGSDNQSENRKNSAIVKYFDGDGDTQSEHFKSPNSSEIAKNLKEGSEKESENMKRIHSSPLEKGLQDKKKLSEKLENLVFSPIVESPRDVGKQSENTEDLKSSEHVMDLQHLIRKQSVLTKNLDPANDKNMRDGQYQKSENVNILTPRIVKIHRQDLCDKQSVNEKNLESTIVGTIQENLKTIHSTAIVKSLGDKHLGNLKNDHSPILPHDLQEICGQQSENVKALDSPAIVKNLQNEGIQQSEETQPEKINRLDFTSFAKDMQDIDEKPSENLKNLDSLVIVKETIEPSALAKELLDVNEKESEIMINPTLVKNIRDVSDMQSDHFKSLNSPEIIENVKEVSRKLSENTENLVSSKIVASRGEDSKETPSMENLRSPVLVMDFRQVIRKQPVPTKNRDPSIDEDNRDGKYHQSENVNVLTIPAVVKNYLQDSCEKQSGDEKKFNSPTIGGSIEDVSSKKCDNMKSLDSPATVKNLKNIGDKQSGNLQNPDLPIPVKDFKDVDEKQSANMKNVDPQNVENLQYVYSKQSGNSKILYSPANVKNLQNEGEQQSVNMKHLGFSSLAKEMQDVGEDESENMNNCDSLVIVKDLKEVVFKQSESMKNLESSALVKELPDVDEKESEIMKNPDSAIVRNTRDVDDLLSEHFKSLSSPEMVENLKEVSQKQTETVENLVFSPIVESLREVGKQSESMENHKSPTLVMDVRYVIQKKAELMKDLDPTVDKSIRGGADQQLENLNIFTSTLKVKNHLQDTCNSHSGDEKNLDLPTISVRTLQDVGVDSPAFVENLQDIGGKQSRNLKKSNSPILAKYLHAMDGKQSANMKNYDTINAFVTNLQKEGEQQSEDTQLEMMSSPNFSSLVKNIKHVDGKQSEIMKHADPPNAIVKNIQQSGGTQSEKMYELDFSSREGDIGEAQSENKKNRDSLAIANDLKEVNERSENVENLESSVLVKELPGVDEKGSEIMKNLDPVRNIRHVGDMQSEHIKSLSFREVTENLTVVSRRKSEDMENSPRDVVKQSENIKNSPLTMDLRHEIPKQSESMKKFEPENDTNIRDGEYQQSERVNVLTHPATVKNYLQDLCDKQSGDELDSPTIVESMRDVGSKQSENMKNLDSSAIIQNLEDLGVNQSRHLQIPDSPILGKDFKQSANLKNVDPPNSKNLEYPSGQHSEIKVLNSPAMVRSLQKENEESSPLVMDPRPLIQQPVFLNSLDPANDENMRDGECQQSENVDIVTPPVIVENYLQDVYEDKKNLEIIQDVGIGSEQSKNIKILDSSAIGKNLQDIGGRQLGNLQKSDSPMLTKYVQDSEKQSTNMKNVYPPNAIVKNLRKEGEQQSVDTPSENSLSFSSFVKNIQELGKTEKYRTENMENLESSPIVTNLQDVVAEEQSHYMEYTDFPEIAKNLGCVDEKHIENMKNLDLAEKGECRREIHQNLREVSAKQTESSNTLDSTDPQNVGQKQPGNRKNHDTASIVKSLPEIYEQSENVDVLANVPYDGDMESENVKNLTSPAIVQNINEVREKQSDDAKNLDSPAIITSLQDVGSLDILPLVEDLHDMGENKSGNVENIDSSSLVMSLNGVVGKQSENTMDLDLSTITNLMDVTYPQPENMSGLDASVIVMNLQDVGDEQSEYMDDIELPVIANSLQHAEKKYLEHLKSLDLAEKGIARNISGTDEKQTNSSTAHTFKDIRENESGDVCLELSGTTQDVRESGNAEKGTPRNRCSTFVIHSKNFVASVKGNVENLRHVGEANDFESAMVDMPKTHSETKNLPHPFMVNDLKLQVYPMDENEFIGAITIEEDNFSNSVETVIILDQSLSMKNATRRLTNEIIPLVLCKLSHDKLQPVHLVTFATEPLHYCVTADEMKSLSIEPHYGTNMAPCVQKLHSLLQSFDSKKPIRILSISDGEMQDCQATENAVVALTEFLNASDLSITSQAVRIVTSESQPDTRALCAFLRINNTTTSQLVDIDVGKSNETISTTIADLFQSDNFRRSKTLTMEKEIILKFPWNSKPSSQIVLVPGLNVFWLNKIPTGEMKIADSLVKMIVQNPLTLSKFQDLMKSKLVYIAAHLKLLKIVDTTAGNKSVDQIVKYFESREDKLAKYCNGDLAGRKKISNILAGIANDDIMKNVDSATLALYLRDARITQSKITDSSDQRNRTSMANDNKVRSLDDVRVSLQQDVESSERPFLDGHVVKAEFVQEIRKSKSKTNGFELQLHPIHENYFIGTIRIEEDNELNSIETVIILDQLDSIGRLTNEIIPSVLSKLSYEKSQPVHLLTFTKDAQHYFVTAEQMKSLNIQISHGNKMAMVVQKMHFFFQSLNGNKQIRLLTILGGQFQDSKETEEATKDFIQFLDSSNFSINSQIVRLFKKNSREESKEQGTQPVCSLLQINNTTKSQLVDIDLKESTETIATIISGLFLSDKFHMSISLTMEEQIILKFPWIPKASAEIELYPGMNVFWLNKVPTSKIKIRNSPVNVVLQGQLTLTMFQQLMEPKLPHIVDQIRILKVVGTVDGEEKIDRILKYFKCTENELVRNFSIGKYRSRDASSRKKISNFLASIANDESVKSTYSAGTESSRNLDSVERAENLGEISNTKMENGTSSNPRAGLTRRIRNFKFDTFCVFYVPFLIILLVVVTFISFKFLI